MEEFLQGFWAECECNSKEIQDFKPETERGTEKATTFRANIAFRDFKIRKECAERYHKLDYVAKQLAVTQSRVSKDIALLCQKLHELSLEDWECRAYGLFQDGIHHTGADEMRSEDEYFNDMREVHDNSIIGEGADWVMLTKFDGIEKSA